MDNSDPTSTTSYDASATSRLVFIAGTLLHSVIRTATAVGSTSVPIPHHDSRNGGNHVCSREHTPHARIDG